jgi:hypothetical protein
MRSRALLAAALAGVVFLGVWAWRTWWPSDEREIRRRLQALATDFNESTTDGLGTVARAAKIGSYFTNDIVVDLGEGTPPIQGRETIIGMVGRLQPRTSAFKLELLDLNVHVSTPTTAEVNLTAAFRQRSLTTREESLEARELAIAMVKGDNEWRVSRITTVEPFR